MGQLEACLEGKPVDFRRRVNKHKKERHVWRDSLANDYIHVPLDENLEVMYAFQMAMCYKNKPVIKANGNDGGLVGSQ